MNDQHRRGLVLDLGINDPALHRAGAIGHRDTFHVAGRFFQLGLRPILGGDGSNKAYEECQK